MRRAGVWWWRSTVRLSQSVAGALVSGVGARAERSYGRKTEADTHKRGSFCSEFAKSADVALISPSPPSLRPHSPFFVPLTPQSLMMSPVTGAG